MLKYTAFLGEHAGDRRAHTAAFAQFVQYQGHFCGPNEQKNRHLVLLRSNAQAGWPEQAAVLAQALITCSEQACMQAEMSVLLHIPNMALGPPLPPKSNFNY